MKTEARSVLGFGDFRLDLEDRCLLRRDGTEVPLTPRVFETLRYLVEHRGRVIDKESIMGAVWPDCIVEENNLAQNISTLRRILGDTAGSHQYIVTVPSRGYRFVPEVRASQDPGAANHGPVPLAPPNANSNLDVATSAAAIRKSTRPGILLGAIVIMLVLGLAAFLYSHRSTPSQKRENNLIPEKSIAVLPFVNLSDDKQNLYFVAGVQDELLSNLAKIGDLKVISRTSANLYLNGHPRNLREIGEQLGVAHLLEGSVQLTGKRLRINAQLVDARTDAHLWAETYDRNVSDIFAIQTEIAQTITRQLQATLTGSEKRALAAKPTTNFDAYEAYLQGRYFWNRRSTEGYERAVEQFNRAIELDPGFAQAYVGLADATLFLVVQGGIGQQDAIEQGRSYLNQALQLDDTLAEAHASLGLIAMNIDWDWIKAETEFRRAIELNPNYATAHHWYGEFLAYMGRFDEAIAETARAHQLDPLSLIINTDIGKTYVLARRYDDAISQFQATLKMDPDFSEAHGLLALTYAILGRDVEARDEISKIKELETSPIYLSWLAVVHGFAGRKEAARETIDRLNDLAHKVYVSPFWIASAWTSIGDNDEAFKWFAQAFAEHASGAAVSLKVNPLFDGLRSDPRFADLLRRANFNP